MKPKALKISVHDDVTPTERLVKAQGHRPGKKRKAESLIDARDGTDVDIGRPTWTERVYDHVNDEYREKAVVKATGEVLANKIERLSEHRGHGSAKPRHPKT